MRDGIDVTPTLEPDPLLTIDRLVRVRLRPGTSATTDVLLHGACFGTMPTQADLPSGAAESCVDAEKTRSPVTELAERDSTTARATLAGTWLAAPCGAAMSGCVKS